MKRVLSDLLDVESFAAYLAVEELIGNFDDIDGPGNNSYLYYDLKTDRFTVVPWDHNLAFGAMPDSRLPDDRAPGDGARAGAGMRARAQPPEALPGGNVQAGGGPRGKPNVLVERFRAVPEFERLYEQKLAELRDKLYRSGAAERVLAHWVALLEAQASDLVATSTLEREAAKIASYFAAG